MNMTGKNGLGESVRGLPQAPPDYARFCTLSGHGRFSPIGGRMRLTGPYDGKTQYKHYKIRLQLQSIRDYIEREDPKSATIQYNDAMCGAGRIACA